MSRIIDTLGRRLSGKEKYYIRTAAVCHRGNMRSRNEDNLYFQGHILPMLHEGTDGIRLYRQNAGRGFAAAVFDGMGGESAGELASFTAADTMRGLLKRMRVESDEEIFEFCRELNGSVVRAAGKEKYVQIGTTAVILSVQGNEYCLCNVGDSPAYFFREGRLSLISVPHTNYRLLELQGAKGMKPSLTQFLGLDEEDVLIEPHIQRGVLQKGDRILLCSDGLTDMIKDEEIESIMKRRADAGQCVRILLAEALHKGGSDKITIILCDME